MPASKSVRLGRKRVLPSCPNPLFLQWLTELRDEAKEKNHKIHYTYQKAISSLNKYPLPLKNAKEAKILQNFGDGICKILDQKLQKYYRENGGDAPIHSLPRGPPSPRHHDARILPAPPPKRKDGADHIKTMKKKKEYVPQRGSGGYAVLLALHRKSQVQDGNAFMFKMELQTAAQPFCDKSFSVPDPGSKYTAWSSVSTLIQKNLLLKTHSPARYYSLTDEGLALAKRLAAAQEEEEDEEDNVVDLTVSDEDEGDVAAPAECLLPGHYEILLCVDVIETTGGSSGCKQALVAELQRNKVLFDVRKLNVGDFLWVAREKVPPPTGQRAVRKEFVLDFIVERKRMDDLCSSIVDGRFREQKFRLKRCGLSRVVYLVEEFRSSHLSLPEATLQQAVVNTQVVDGFFVKRVQDVRESAAYLTIMTRYLTELYQKRTLFCRSRELEGDVERPQTPGDVCCSLMSFAEFNYGAVKNKCQTVKEVFARQLMQISGLSGDKASAVLEHYGTPHSLLQAYDQCSSEAEKEKLLSSIRYGKLHRNFGPALSRSVYQLYCTAGALT
uniref:Crossover junction endonuclease MUS81 n=1 Tax=Gouania willdenowi TaxID=441366 RepID=A0A8C5H4S2_GOUWI